MTVHLQKCALHLHKDYRLQITTMQNSNFSSVYRRELPGSKHPLDLVVRVVGISIDSNVGMWVCVSYQLNATR